MDGLQWINPVLMDDNYRDTPILGHRHIWNCIMQNSSFHMWISTINSIPQPYEHGFHMASTFLRARSWSGVAWQPDGRRERGSDEKLGYGGRFRMKKYEKWG